MVHGDASLCQDTKLADVTQGEGGDTPLYLFGTQAAW